MSGHFTVSSEEVENLSERSLKNFMKHILSVTKKEEDRRKAREALSKHLQKIKKEARSKKKGKDTLNSHLVELENKVQDLLDKESKLLRSQEYENKIIHELRKKVEILEEELLQKSVENQNLMNVNRDNIQTMQISINSLRQKLKEYIGERTGRERKMQELENKIKLRTKYKEPYALKRLEQKYIEMKNKQDADEETLNKMRERINLLREKANS